MKVTTCPNCDEPLTEILGQDKYRIFIKDGQWHKEEDPGKLVCGKCYEELEQEDIADIMRAVGLL